MTDRMPASTPAQIADTELEIARMRIDAARLVPPALWQRIVALHERTCGNMGPLHIVLEDGNLEDADINYAIVAAARDGARIDDEVERLDCDEACSIGCYLRGMAAVDRQWLYRAVRAIHRPSGENVTYEDALRMMGEL